jgi:hypothetical protein
MNSARRAAGDRSLVGLGIAWGRRYRARWMGGEVQITEDQRLQMRCARRRSRMGRWRRMSSSSSKTTRGSGGSRWVLRGCVAVSLDLLGGVETLVILIRRVLGVLGVFMVDCCGSKIEQGATRRSGRFPWPVHECQRERLELAAHNIWQ